MFTACAPFPFQCASRTAFGSGLMNAALLFLPVARSVNAWLYFAFMRESWIHCSTVNASIKSHFVVSLTR